MSSVSPFRILVKKCFLYQVCILGLGLALCFEGVTRFTSLALNQSDSLPQRVFLILKRKKVQREGYVSFKNDWFKAPLIKQVIGLEGDKMIYDNEGFLWVARKIGKPLSQSKEGKTLRPVDPKIIPANHVFVYASHPRSFDSRYQDVGLIPVDSILGEAIPLF